MRTPGSGIDIVETGQKSKTGSGPGHATGS